MKLDWCKDSGRWNIWSIRDDALLAKVAQVTLLVPSALITTDGGRHGYLIAHGELEVDEGTNSATIRSVKYG